MGVYQVKSKRKKHLGRGDSIEWCPLAQSDEGPGWRCKAGWGHKTGAVKDWGGLF